MPVVGIHRVADVNEGIDRAYEAEHGYRYIGMYSET